MKITLTICLLTPLCCLIATGCNEDSMDGSTDVPAPAPTSGNMPTAQPEGGGPEFVALRVGNGTTSLAQNVAAPVFLERMKIADGGKVGQPIVVPTAASGMQKALTLSGAEISEGGLTRSADGHYVLFAGYSGTPGTRNVIDTSQRVIGRLSSSYTVDTSTSWMPGRGAGNNIRGVASTDGNALWTAEVAELGYAAFGGSVAPTNIFGGNIRGVSIYAGQLYASRQSNTAGGIVAMGMGLPTSTAVAVQLTGFGASGSMLSPYGFVAFDLDSMPGIDRIYVADDRTGAQGGVQRWTLTGGNWMLEGTMSTGLTSGARGLDGYKDGNNIVLLATTSETGGGQTRIVSFTDPGGPVAGIMPRVLANSAANTAYRGVALAPM